MAIPKFEDFLYPFMLHLMEQDSNKSDMVDYMCKYFNLSYQDRMLTTKNGGTTQVYDRVGWGLQWLRRALFVDIPFRGVWRISERGKKYMSQNKELKEIDLLKYPEFAKFSNRKRKGKKQNTFSNNNTIEMIKNEDWNEIVEFIKPIINSKTTYSIYFSSIINIFRILGSMVR